MTKDEALDLALEALEDIGDEWGFTSQRTVPKRKEAITAIKQVRALDKKAENARELGLDYGPVAWSDTRQSELNDWFLSLPTERQAVLLEDKWMLAGAAFLAGKTTPPAAQLAPEQYTALEQALTRLQKRYAELEAKIAAQRQWDYDTLYAAWHAVGADVAGLKWETFVAKLKEKNNG